MTPDDAGPKTASLPSRKAYGGVLSNIDWRGRHVTDSAAFAEYLSDRVGDRVYDSEEQDRFEADMGALATSEMGKETLERLLSADRTEREPWEVGEAIAECLLADRRGVSWPSHTDRDKRTPRAILPGADLIGFVGTEANPYLAIGEVKTSNDGNHPPSVMYGRSGMVNQLDILASQLEVHVCILKWLRPRCAGTPLWPLFEEAAKRYLASGGKDIVLYGMLMRDVEPNDNDLRARVAHLATSVSEPTAVYLAAWYLPLPVDQWLDYVRRAA